MRCGGGNARLQPHIYTALPQLLEREIGQSWPHFREDALPAMQKNNFYTLPRERGVVFGNFVYKVVYLPYRFDTAVPCSGHHVRKKFLANDRISLHFGDILLLRTSGD